MTPSKSKRTRHVHRWGKWDIYVDGRDYSVSRVCRGCGKWENMDHAEALRILNKPRPKVRYRKVGTVETVRDGSPEGISPGVVLYAQLTSKRLPKKGRKP